MEVAVQTLLIESSEAPSDKRVRLVLNQSWLVGGRSDLAAKAVTESLICRPKSKKPRRIAPWGFEVTKGHAIYFSQNNRKSAFVKRFHADIQIGQSCFEIAQPCVCAVAVLHIKATRFFWSDISNHGDGVAAVD